jgi:hypothetical protein
MSDMSTIDTATDWLREHHDAGRFVPSRLHRHDTEGELGAPPFTGAFVVYLDGRPTDEITVRESVDCDHLHDATWPKCAVERAYYRAPMWRALWLLSGRTARRPHQPAPYALVTTLLESGYDWRRTSSRLRLPFEFGEALILMALRDLYRLYALGPVPSRPWTALSDSQRAAMEGVSSAA